MRKAVMTLAPDPQDKFSEYAHPERLVSTAWLADHLDAKDLVVVESDEDVLLYETGHCDGKRAAVRSSPAPLAAPRPTHRTGTWQPAARRPTAWR